MDDIKNKDYLGADASALLHKKLFLLDMDGTIYEEDRLFDGTLDLLYEIEKRGGRTVFITNNSSKSVNDYVANLCGMGVPVTAEHFFTSTQATILHFKEHFPGKQVYCMGTRSFISELTDAGMDVTTEVTTDAAAILVGFDPELTGDKLRNTCEMLQQDLPYIATNPDLTCPVSFGFIPDCGSVCGMLQNATGKKPQYIGKPEPTMVTIVREQFGYAADETVVIGDRLYTDIAAGRNAGVSTICVLSGEATLLDIQNEDLKPTYVFESVKEIYNMLK